MSTLIAARREEEKELRRHAILDAARRVIGRDGVEGATMGRIAKEARLSRALLYVYFKDLDDLRWALAAEGLSRLRDYFEEAAARGENGLDALERMGWAYVRLSREHPVEWELIAHKEVEELSMEMAGPAPAGGGGPLDHAEVCQGVGTAIHEMMAGQVARGVEDGSVRADVGDPLTTALVLWGATHGLLQIARMKEVMLDGGYGIAPQAYLEKGIEMMTRSMAS